MAWHPGGMSGVGLARVLAAVAFGIVAVTAIATGSPAVGVTFAVLAVVFVLLERKRRARA